VSGNAQASAPKDLRRSVQVAEGRLSQIQKVMASRRERLLQARAELARVVATRLDASSSLRRAVEEATRRPAIPATEAPDHAGGRRPGREERGYPGGRPDQVEAADRHLAAGRSRE
jgi:hypothetical protein